MNNRTPKTQLGVKGNMSQRGADRVGLILSLAALTAVIFGGVVGILVVI